MINIENIKEYIKCPQFGDKEYGEWGALRLEQRVAYKELIEEIEKLNYIIDKQDRDIIALSNGNRKLKARIDKAIEYIKVCKNNDMGIRYQRIEEILQGSDK